MTEPDWEVVLLRPAEKYLARQPRPERKRILRSLLALQADPFAGDVYPVAGAPGWWRLRIGGYRALLQVDRELRRLVVADIGPRGDFYRR